MWRSYSPKAELRAAEVEFSEQYLARIGVRATPSAVRLVRERMPLARCAVTVGYRARGNEYHVDFSDMTQTNTASSVERRIRRVDPSAAASAPVWEFEDGPSGSGAWRRFDADGAAQAESARGGQFCFGRGSGTYFVDTGAMTQTNIETSVSRRIRRRLA